MWSERLPWWNKNKIEKKWKSLESEKRARFDNFEKCATFETSQNWITSKQRRNDEIQKIDIILR